MNSVNDGGALAIWIYYPDKVFTIMDMVVGI